MPANRVRTMVVAAAVALAAGAGLLLWTGAFGGGPRVDLVGHVYTVRQGRLVYQFDAAWRVERLYEAAGGDPDWRHDVAPSRPVEVARLRTVLLESLGFHSLEQVPLKGEKEKRALKGLGYL